MAPRCGHKACDLRAWQLESPISDDDGSASPAAAASSLASLSFCRGWVRTRGANQRQHRGGKKSPHCATRAPTTDVRLTDSNRAPSSSSSRVAATPAKVANLRHHQHSLWQYVHRIIRRVCALLLCLPGCDKNKSRCAQGLTWSRDPLLIRFVTTESARSPARQFAGILRQPPRPAAPENIDTIDPRIDSTRKNVEI